MKSIIFTAIFNILFLGLTAQNAKLHITGGNVNITNSGSTTIVLNNTKFINDGTLDAGNGEVEISGNAPTANSIIGGNSTTTFYKLNINKASHTVRLHQNITVNHNLKLTSGLLELGNYNLSMGDNATFTNINKDRYIKTNGTGTLKRKVGNSFVIFPVGKAHFNPARLKNDGTIDIFSVRVIDHFYQNGTSGNSVTTNVVPKTWLIDEAVAGGSDVTMRLIWRPVHQTGIGFNANNAQITHYTGGAWKDEGTAGAATNDNSFSSDHRYREATNITSFSPFGVKSGASLPVELLYFYAEKEGKNVRLDWQTATEINNSHFDVEWSTDGISFEKIGEVAGAGTTNEVQFYEFFDDLNRVGFENRHGLHYYRLRQVDFDGKYEYTDIISVEFTQSRTITFDIYQNPASHYLKIESEDLIDEVVQIFNVNGQLVIEFQHQSLITNLPITDIPSGTYFIKMGTQVKKVIIQK